MIYTQAVIQEIFRLAVIVPIIPPRAFTKDFEYKGYFFKKGTPIYPNYYSIAMDPTLWNEPHIFNPHRFLSNDGKSLINTQKHSPFGFGKRICMGNIYFFFKSEYSEEIK